MIEIIPSDKRHLPDLGLITSYWLFSFSDYYDPDNVRFGSLRIFNDDFVPPQCGFATHPHKEMEIISLVLEGEIQHQDTIGNRCRIQQHQVFRMTAGTGLHHSEWNYGKKPVHFLQMWILPDTRDLAPSFDQKKFNPGIWKNRLAPLASKTADAATVTLNTDAQIYRAQLDANRKIRYETDCRRKIFIYLIHGSITINGKHAGPGDQARIYDEEGIDIHSHQADLLLLDLPASAG